MVRLWRIYFLATGASLLGCIGLSADMPNGGFDIVSLELTPPEGKAQVAADAGRLEFGGVAKDTAACIDTASCEAGADSISVISYEWAGDSLVPLWAPERVPFKAPEWDGPNDTYKSPIPIANLSCLLARESRHPLVLIGDCDGPDAGGFAIVLEMDR